MNEYQSQVERRITLRLLGYWERLRGERPMPTEEDVDPDQLSDIWDSCFLVHVKDLGKPDYNYTYLGEAIMDAYQGYSSTEEGGLVSPNATKLAKGYSQVIETRKPLLEEGEFRNTHNQIVKYRQCLLPLGMAEEVVAIFGGMRFKVFTPK